MAIVGDDAVDAALDVLASKNLGPMSPDLIREMIEAALPHIPEAQAGGGRFTPPQAAIDAGVEALIRSAFDPALVKVERVLRAATPYLAGVEIPEGASTERERNAERRHREEIARVLARPVSAEPSDYEVWRDALQLAVQRLGGRVGNVDRDELLGLAEWFWARLDEVPVRASADDDAEPFRPDLGDVE